MDMGDRVDKYLNDKKFNGSILMAKGGDVWLSKGYGMANFEKGIPNTGDTIFRIGSVTKPFTALSILKLQEEGLVHVEDTLDTYISDYPNGNEITIHHLLTHTSGIQEYLQIDALNSLFQKYNSPLDIIHTFKEKPLHFTPGTKFSYSNSNYILLGYIIEKVSYESYEKYLYNNITGPLNMNNTGYGKNEFDEHTHAIGYQGTATEHTAPMYTIDMSVPFAAGALYSSVEDLFLWDQALYTDKLISEQSLRTMLTPSIEVQKDQLSYAYGWLIYHNPQGLAGHGGNIFGYSTTFLRNPENESLIIVMCNFDSYLEIDAIARHLNQILDEFIE